MKFEREVVSVGLVDSDNYSRWRVKSMNHKEEEEEEFDAVVVCNGHYTEPRVADVPGKLFAAFTYRLLHIAMLLLA